LQRVERVSLRLRDWLPSAARSATALHAMGADDLGFERELPHSPERCRS
jgi:hypothetical protein